MQQSLRGQFIVGLRIAKDAIALKTKTSKNDELYGNAVAIFATSKAMIAHCLLIEAYTRVKNRKTFDARDVVGVNEFLEDESRLLFSSGTLVRAFRVYCYDEGLCEYREEAK